VLAIRSGVVAAIDNRRLANIAKLAGAPGSASAGLDCRLRIGDRIDAGEPLLQVHAQSPGELEYALEYANAHPDIFAITEPR
jgi:thymidine phosphorylase